ncbi:MAG: hypothetical protein NC395_05850 [Prevotella sp.]|nr:hypothetical protein [Prevotella sp.]
MSIMETAAQAAVKTAETASKVHPVVGVLVGAGVFLAGLGASGICDIVGKIIDNNEKKKRTDNN